MAKSTTTTTQRTTRARNATSKPKPPKTTPKEVPSPQGTTDKPVGPGVIATIVEVLTKATAKKPLTKAELLDELVKRIPDRTPEAMMRTIHCQVPSRLRSEKKLNVKKNDDKAFWIEK